MVKKRKEFWRIRIGKENEYKDRERKGIHVVGRNRSKAFPAEGGCRKQVFFFVSPW